jgi:crossover junction endodeoxyribonuclease RusA
MVESSKAVKPWRQDVIAAARDHHQGEPLDGPLELTITFWLPRPSTARKSAHWQWKTPDIDKLIRSTGDALKLAGTIRDDSRFCNILASKRLVPIGGGPTGAEITIAKLEE